MNCTAFTYYVHHTNGKMHMCLIASSIKIITKRVAVGHRFKPARMVSCLDLRICVFLGCDRPQSNMLKKLPKMLLEYCQNFYLLCSSYFPLCLYYAST